MSFGKWFRRGRKSDDDLYRPLSEQENELVEHDAALQSKYDEAPAAATPDAPINADDVSEADLPLSEGEREVVQRDVDEQTGHDVP